jgi:hypothetical protein
LHCYGQEERGRSVSEQRGTRFLIKRGLVMKSPLVVQIFSRCYHLLRLFICHIFNIRIRVMNYILCFIFGFSIFVVTYSITLWPRKLSIHQQCGVTFVEAKSRPVLKRLHPIHRHTPSTGACRLCPHMYSYGDITMVSRTDCLQLY